MSEQKKKSWVRKHPVWTILIGILAIIILSMIFGESPEEQQANQNLVAPQSNNENVVKNENIGKIIKLNSCDLDFDNADYWQGKEVNFWANTNRDSVVFKLPACDSIELEVIDYANEDGNELLKVKSGDQEGWISKMQLMK